jgi:uncharacterized membrane protein YphA (DoxX/SURF4 family)
MFRIPLRDEQLVGQSLGLLGAPNFQTHLDRKLLLLRDQGGMAAMAAWLELFCRLVVGVAFLYSAFSKLVRLPSFSESLLSIDIPRTTALAMAPAIVVVEAGVSALLLIGSGLALWIGYATASVLLTAFSGFIVWRLRQPRAVRGECLCFGRSETYDSSHMVRNITFLSLVVAGAVTSLWPASQSGLTVDESIVTLVAAVTAVALATNLSQLRSLLFVPSTPERY